MTRKWIGSLLAASALVCAAPSVLAHVGGERTSNERKNLATFEDLDFRVFSERKWSDLRLSHAEDVVVHWPDGHTTDGIERHIIDLDWMYTFAPDTRIVEHPARIAENEWTAVTGYLVQTFTRPMKTPDGKTLAPTGRQVKLPMATFGRWKDGKVVEEYMYWDNREWYRQLGISP